MESNFKYPIYVVSSQQDNDYWKEFLSQKTITAAFYRLSDNDLPIMVQNISDIPSKQVIWLEPYVLENGIAKLIPIKERPLMETEWLDTYNSKQFLQLSSSTLYQQLDSYEIDILTKLDLLKKHFEFETSYMEKMRYAIEQAKNGNHNYKILGNSITLLNNLKSTGMNFTDAINSKVNISLTWTIEYVFGELLLLQQRLLNDYEDEENTQN